MNGASDGSLHQTQKKCSEFLKGALTTEKLVGPFIRATLPHPDYSSQWLLLPQGEHLPSCHHGIGGDRIYHL